MLSNVYESLCLYMCATNIIRCIKDMKSNTEYIIVSIWNSRKSILYSTISRHPIKKLHDIFDILYQFLQLYLLFTY